MPATPACKRGSPVRLNSGSVFINSSIFRLCRRKHLSTPYLHQRGNLMVIQWKTSASRQFPDSGCAVRYIVLQKARDLFRQYFHLTVISTVLILTRTAVIVPTSRSDAPCLPEWERWFSAMRCLATVNRFFR